MIYRFKQVDKHLFRGSAPTIEDVVELYKKYGVRKIVSLDYSAGKHINRVCKILGIEHKMIPIEVERKSSLLHFLNRDLKELLSCSKGNVFVHCIEGKDRTGLACALYHCQYQDWNCKDALHEARSLGFGIGVPKKIVKLYTKIIQQICKCNEKEDVNKAMDETNPGYDIVSNQREYPTDYRSYDLGPWQQASFAPYADYGVREFPYTGVNKDFPEQYQNRQDYKLNNSLTDPKEFAYGDGEGFPMIGEYDENTQGIGGSGPSYVGSGFI